MICLTLVSNNIHAENDEAVDAEVEDSSVLVLTDKTFGATIEKYEMILVEYYAPWCGHCKALTPEYEKAAKILKEKESPVKLAKVDATVEKEIAGIAKVKGFPTLKFYINGKATEYTGPREAKGIVSWVEKKSGPAAAVVSTAEEVEKLVGEGETATLGIFASASADGVKPFLEAAMVSEHKYLISYEEAMKKEFGLDADGIVLVKKFDDGNEIYGGIVGAEAIETWTKASSMPYVNEFSMENAPKIFGTDVKVHMIAMMPKPAENEAAMNELKIVGKKFRGKLMVISLDSTSEENGQVLEFFGLDNGVTTYLIFEMEKSAKYLSARDEMTSAAMIEHADKYFAGELKRTLKGAKPPTDWDKEAVKVLVSDNFQDVAMDTSKDVFIEFYAPWCGHCKSLAPVWDQLGEKFQGSADVVIAKMDSTANEVEEVEVKSFPTLKMIKKETNEIIDYTGDRNLDAFIKFVETGEMVKAEGGAGGDTEEDIDYPEDDYDYDEGDSEEAQDDEAGHDEL